MKLTLFLSVILMLNVKASVYSQNNRITLSYKEVLLENVLDKIKEQSDFTFLYRSDLLSGVVVKNVDIKKESLNKTLDKVLTSQGYDYEIIDKTVVVRKALINVNEQQIVIKGKITDSEDNSLPGVNIVEVGTTNGAVTDLEGKYSISVSSPMATLSFSYIGYLTEVIEINNQTKIDIVLVEDILALEEVVVIGYGRMKKSDLTGAITSVSVKDFDKVPATTPLTVLQGRSPGLEITSGSGLPGAGASVFIRGIGSINGSNEPIYVVDNVITNNINYLNPSNIESVSVLKDASASAIYGARAANGVILVTTKRGEGKKDLQISLNSYFGVQTEGNLKLKELNASQFLELFTEAYENANLDVPWDDEVLAHYTGIDTDWKGLMLQNGIIQNYDMSIEGGSEKSNYFISAGMLDQKGMVIETAYKKYTLTFNTDHKVNNRIKFGNSLNMYAATKDGNDTAYKLALRKSPLTKAYEDDGDYGIIYDSHLEHIHANPVWLAKESTINTISKGLQGNIYLTLTLMKGLEFTARENVDYGTSYASDFIPGVPSYYGWEGTSINTATKRYTETVHWISDFLLNYNTTIKTDHKIGALLGYSREKSQSEYLEGSRTGTPNNDIQYLDAGDPGEQYNSNGFSDWSFVSMFGRLNYTFKNKYLFTATIRRDGTSRLSEGHKYGVFPSASFAWRASEEGFMKDVGFIDDLKLRTSYGTLGNVLSVGVYGTSSNLSPRRANVNQQQAAGYTLASAVNTDITWESAAKANAGLDVTMLNSKLYTTIDYFIENTYDLLFSDPIPPSTGLAGKPLINAGQVRNTGYEIEIGYRNKKSDWSYDISANLTHVDNKVIDLGGRDLRTSGLVEGYPVKSYFGYRSNGIIYNEEQLAVYPEGSPFETKQIGDIALLDIDGYDDEGNLTGVPDGKVNGADRTLLQSRHPKFVYGTLGTLSYKNWALQVQLQGVVGKYLNFVPNSYEDAIVLMTAAARTEDARVLNRYHPTKNPTGTWPRLSRSTSGSNTVLSDFWLGDATYLRIKNVNLNYSLPQMLCSKLGMKGLGLYVSVVNAFVFTKYGGPEVDTTADPVAGIPQPRTWTAGFKASF